MDVCLNWFGHCNYVSSKHACIFYDEVSVMIRILQIFSAYFIHSEKFLFYTLESS